MNRVKTFDSSGVPPNGELYAADLNAIQDAAAGLSDLLQHLSVADLTIGEVGLLLSRFGAGQAQLSGALRVTAGVLPGALTTTQRDALAAGRRPPGLVIFNTTTNQHETNVGSDATPSWIPVGGDQAGVVKMYAGAAAPAGYAICDGSALSRTTYAALFANIGTTWGVGDGSTTFNIPDYRGRAPVGVGTHADVNALAKNDGRAVASRRPLHTHDTTLPNSTTGPGSSGTLVGPAGVVTSTVDGPAYGAINFIIKL